MLHLFGIAKSIGTAFIWCLLTKLMSFWSLSQNGFSCKLCQLLCYCVCICYTCTSLCCNRLLFHGHLCTVNDQHVSTYTHTHIKYMVPFWICIHSWSLWWSGWWVSDQSRKAVGTEHAFYVCCTWWWIVQLALSWPVEFNFRGRLSVSCWCCWHC